MELSVFNCLISCLLLLLQVCHGLSSTPVSACKKLQGRFLRSNDFEGFTFNSGTWKVVNGSENLDPKVDHTLGTSEGHYVIVSGNVSELSLLNSYTDVPCEPVCASFYYSMPGTGHVINGGLDVIYGEIGGNITYTAASIGSYSPSGWHQNKVTLRPGKNPIIYKLRGSSPDPSGTLSIAVDDISYTRGECTAMGDADFGRGSAGYIIEGKGKHLLWQLSNGALGNADSSANSSRGGYMWINSTQSVSSGKATLTSPLIVAERDEVWRCLTFWYYLTEGELTVRILEQLGGDPNKMLIGRQIWMLSNDTFGKWRQFTTYYTINDYKQYKVQFEGDLRNGMTTIAIDDIAINGDSCPLTTTLSLPPTTESLLDTSTGISSAPVPACKKLNGRFLRSNDFEEYPLNRGTWKVVNGNENLDPKVDHTLGTNAGHYVILSGNVSELSLLNSFIGVPCEPVCVSFYYSMPGTGHVINGGLDIIYGEIGGNITYTAASIRNYSPPGWHQRKVTLRPEKNPIIYKLRGSSPDSSGTFSLAIDDISYTRGECTADTTTAFEPSTTTSSPDTTEPLQTTTTGADVTSGGWLKTSTHSTSILELTTSSQLSLNPDSTTGQYSTTNIYDSTASTMSSLTSTATMNNKSIMTFTPGVESTSKLTTTSVSHLTSNKLLITSSSNDPVSTSTNDPVSTLTNDPVSTSANDPISTTPLLKTTSSSKHIFSSTTTSTVSPATQTSGAPAATKGTTTHLTKGNSMAQVATPMSSSTDKVMTTPSTQTTQLIGTTEPIGASGDNNKQNKDDSLGLPQEIPWFTLPIAVGAGALLVLLIVVVVVVRYKRRGKTNIQPVRTYSMTSKPFDDGIVVGNPLYGESGNTLV